MSVSLYGSGNTILQVVQATTTTSTNTNSTSFVDTALSATITPLSTTSKILVMVQGNIWMFTGASGYNCYAVINAVRNGTQVTAQSLSEDCQNAPNGPTMNMPVSITYLDSPATTSALTYKVQIKLAINNYSNQITFLRNDNSANPIGTITLLEVSGS